jgi:RNA polymerase sigma-70 factor (ECF subfamily)
VERVHKRQAIVHLQLNLFPSSCVLSSRQSEGVTLRPDRQILESELLVTRCQRGDAQAFEGLVHLWERSLFYYLRRLAPGEADAWDLLQETWLKAFRSIRTLRDPRTFPAFLYATARNNAVSRFRLRTQDDAPMAGANGSIADCAFVAFDNAEQVHHALDQLPLLQREALTLYFLEDLSIEDIARVLTVPEGTVKSRLHYAKQAIKKILTNERPT